MAWIEEITRDRATGLLKRELDAAVRRSGRVWNIVQVLSRFQRELLATVVSAELDCFY